MKFKKLYANKLLKTIIFNEDINVVFANAHSVGKTKFLEIIDFCLLKDKPSFLKHSLFNDEDFAFFLEIENFGNYITIKRYLNKRMPIYIQTSDKSIECLDLNDNEFEYTKLGIEKAKEVLSDILCLKLHNFRRYISYFLRTQDDQSDIFRLNKYKRSKDKEFKPIVVDLLGIDGELIKSKYNLEENIEKIDNEINYILSELKDLTKEYIEAEKNKLLEILKVKEELYKQFDFYKEEDKKSKQLVDSIEQEIARLNKQKVSLYREIDYINQAIQSEFLIDIKDIEELFDELNLIFPDKIKNNYKKIIQFNKTLSQDRKKVMLENKYSFQKELEDIDIKLQELNKKRKEIISIVFDDDSFSKFKKLEKEIINISTKIELLNEKIAKFKRLEELENKKETLNKQLKTINKNIKSMIEKINKGNFSQIIDKFAKIIFEESAIFVVSINKNHNLEFKLKVADNDNFENEKDDGHTYRKLLSFLFSIAVLIYNKDDRFFRFAVIDSPFDGGIYKYQKGLFEAIDVVTKEYDLQIILTTIEDEIKDKVIFEKLKKEYEIIYLTEENKLLGNF